MADGSYQDANISEYWHNPILPGKTVNSNHQNHCCILEGYSLARCLALLGEGLCEASCKGRPSHEIDRRSGECRAHACSENSDLRSQISAGSQTHADQRPQPPQVEGSSPLLPLCKADAKPFQAGLCKITLGIFVPCCGPDLSRGSDRSHLRKKTLTPVSWS